MREMHHINFLASYTLGHAIDHVSGLNIGGEQRPVLPVTIGDDASIDQALAFEKGDALFDVRHRFVDQLRSRAADAEANGRDHGARRGRMAGERDRPGADRLPDWRLRSDDRHSLPDQQAGRDLRSERQRAAHSRSVVRHLLLRAPRRARYRHAARERRPQHRPRARFCPHRSVVLQEHRRVGRTTGFSCAPRRSTCSIRLGSASRATRSERRISGASRARKMAGSFSSRRSTVSRRFQSGSGDSGSGSGIGSAVGGRRSGAGLGARRLGRTTEHT